MRQGTISRATVLKTIRPLLKAAGIGEQEVTGITVRGNYVMFEVFDADDLPPRLVALEINGPEDAMGDL